MKKTLAAAVAVGAIVTSAFNTPAHALDPQGRRCRFVSNTDPTAETDTQVGEADAGPIVLTDGPGTLSCAIYVNGAFSTQVASHSVGVNATAQVAAVAGTISYHAIPSDVVAECTVITYDNGSVVYWHAGATPGLGTWDPAPIVPANCGQAITIDPNPEACPVLLAIDARTVPLGVPSLADIWQDCGPYAPII